MIQIEKTPNPNAVKFIGNKKFSSVGSQEFQSKNIGEVKNVFIKKLLELDGVELIFVSEDFLSVKKNDKVVIVAGTPPNKEAATNLIRVMKIGEF